MLKEIRMSEAKHEDIVRRGVAAFAKAEKSLEDLINALNELGEIGLEGVNAGLATDPTAAIKEAYRLRSIAGQAADLADPLYTIHRIWSTIAQEKGYQTALPAGYIVARDGGR